MDTQYNLHIKTRVEFRCLECGEDVQSEYSYLASHARSVTSCDWRFSFVRFKIHLSPPLLLCSPHDWINNSLTRTAPRTYPSLKFWWYIRQASFRYIKGPAQKWKFKFVRSRSKKIECNKSLSSSHFLVVFNFFAQGLKNYKFSFLLSQTLKDADPLYYQPPVSLHTTLTF